MKEFALLLLLFSVQYLVAGSYTQSGTATASCITITIPNGATGINFNLTMTDGDWDLYVNYPGYGCPTTGTYDCVSWNGGTSAEFCETYSAPSTFGSGSSDYHVLVDPWTTAGTWILNVTWADYGGPPANDNCAGATSLTLDECNWTSFVLPKEATPS